MHTQLFNYSEKQIIDAMIASGYNSNSRSALNNVSKHSLILAIDDMGSRFSNKVLKNIRKGD